MDLSVHFHHFRNIWNSIEIAERQTRQAQNKSDDFDHRIGKEVLNLADMYGKLIRELGITHGLSPDNLDIAEIDQILKPKQQPFNANSTRDWSEINSTARKTRKDFEPRTGYRQNYSYRETLSASPVCKNRRNQEHYTDSDEIDPDDYDETAQEIEDYNFDPSQVVSEIQKQYQPKNPDLEEPVFEEDLNSPIETPEDYKKLSLKDLIYKLFLNIYNSEKASIKKLKNEIFPRITEDTRLDDYITDAIANCMDHVKDELHSYITKHLKCQRKIKSELSHKSIINDCMFISFLGHEKLYDDVIDKVIDFYELFKCSVDSIVDVWKEKLGHIDKLHLIFDFRHKK